MLSQTSLPSSVIEAIRHHHERLDGSGYTRQLAGEEIPIMAKIIGVTDSFDAMTSARPYHQPMAIEEAIAELNRCRNHTLDASCVDALVEAVKSGELSHLLPGKEPVLAGAK